MPLPLRMKSLFTWVVSSFSLVGFVLSASLTCSCASAAFLSSSAGWMLCSACWKQVGNVATVVPPSKGEPGDVHRARGGEGDAPSVGERGVCEHGSRLWSDAATSNVIVINIRLPDW